MRRNFILCALLLITVTQAHTQQLYTLGVVPQFNEEQTRVIWQPVIDEIRNRTDIQLILINEPDGMAFEKSLLSGKFDFAYINADQMLQAHQQQGYIPLVRDTSNAISTLTTVPFDNNISYVAESTKSNIDFPPPDALGASLLIRPQRHDQFDLLIQPLYIKPPGPILLDSAVQQKPGEPSKITRDKLRLLHSSDKAISHPIAVHPRVIKSISRKLQKTLLSLGDDNSGKKLLSNIPIKNIGITSMAEYEPSPEKLIKKFSTSTD